MATNDTRIAQHGYQPLTEGYQPGQNAALQKGYTPTPASSTAQSAPPPPPKGGSSAAKPSQK